jgi:hypothetical protein
VNQQLTNLERAILEKMLTGENSELKILREQFSKVTVSKSEMTGSGFFTNLEVPATLAPLSRKGRVTITDISANLPKLKNGAGFVLFVDNGAINCLEGFCYDETWPDSTMGFELSYLQELPPRSGKLIQSKQRDIDFALKDFAS